MLASLLGRAPPLPFKSPHLGPPAKIPPIDQWHQHAAPFLRLRRVWASLLAFVFTIFFLIHFTNRPPPTPPPTIFPDGYLKPTLWRELEALGHKREVVFQPTEVTWHTDVTQKTPVPWSHEALFPAVGGTIGHSSTELEQHIVSVFPRRPVLAENAPQASELLFGIVTTAQRARMMSELWERWMLPPSTIQGTAGDRDEHLHDIKDRPACLVLLSAEEAREDVEGLRQHFKERGLPCDVRTSDYERYEVRVLSMAVEMRKYAKDVGRQFSWYCYGDDDTFWLDLRTLRRLLGKYDKTEDWFIGASTEAQAQLDQFGRMAFGGAGMLVSDPLSLKMYNVWDDCWSKYRHVFGGDEMITRCAALATGKTKDTVTTEEAGMHQFDIPGDTTGVFQGGIPFLNLHHYIGGFWVHIFGYGSYLGEFDQIRVIKKAAAFLGGDNMFRRLVFGDGKWLVTLGYSVTIFEERLTKEMMSKMEHTWYEGYKLSYDDRPHIWERRDDNGPVKQTFYLDDIHVTSPHTATFTYAMADNWDENLSSEERPRLTIHWDGCWDKPTDPVCRKARKPDAGALVRP